MNQANYPTPQMPTQPNPWATEISGMPPVYMNPDQMQSNPPQSAQQDIIIASSVDDPHLNMNHGQSDTVIQTPQDRQEVYTGSLKAMLSNNLGNHIVATFLMGTQNMVSWEGILYEVGNNFITIYQPDKGRYIIGDLYALKFMEFYEPTTDSPLCPPQKRTWQAPM